MIAKRFVDNIRDTVAMTPTYNNESFSVFLATVLLSLTILWVINMKKKTVVFC